MFKSHERDGSIKVDIEGSECAWTAFKWLRIVLSNDCCDHSNDVRFIAFKLFINQVRNY
jgi:hypothetical protein